jgi:hypothetical protein
MVSFGTRQARSTFVETFRLCCFPLQTSQIKKKPPVPPKKELRQRNANANTISHTAAERWANKDAQMLELEAWSATLGPMAVGDTSHVARTSSRKPSE